MSVTSCPAKIRAVLPLNSVTPERSPDAAYKCTGSGIVRVQGSRRMESLLCLENRGIPGRRAGLLEKRVDRSSGTLRKRLGSGWFWRGRERVRHRARKAKGEAVARDSGRIGVRKVDLGFVPSLHVRTDAARLQTVDGL